MTVNELIQALQKVDNQEAQVFIWIDGGRWAIDPNIPVDNELSDSIIDINLKDCHER